jgi:hypothetical protein
MLSDQRRRPLLHSLVGSRAHNLARPDSDYDFRGVFIVPTVDLLTLGHNTKNTQWIEGRVDDASWEVGHFLFLATKCNPNILDVFRAEPQPMPVQDLFAAATGAMLLRLWPRVVSRVPARAAFLGYAHNQFKKMMDQEAVDTPRVWKFGTTYLRVLQQGIDLQQTGEYSLAIEDSTWRAQLRAVQEGRVTRGEIVDLAVRLQACLYRAEQESVLPDAPDLDAVNHFLLAARRHFWDWGENDYIQPDLV